MEMIAVIGRRNYYLILVVFIPFEFLCFISGILLRKRKRKLARYQIFHTNQQLKMVAFNNFEELYGVMFSFYVGRKGLLWTKHVVPLRNCEAQACAKTRLVIILVNAEIFDEVSNIWNYWRCISISPVSYFSDIQILESHLVYWQGHITYPEECGSCATWQHKTFLR